MAKRKILVVVDMQKDFTTGCLGNADCAATIGEVKNVLRDEDYDEYIFTADTHERSYLNTMEGKKLPVEHCIKGTEGAEIVDGLVNLAENRTDKVQIFEKNTFGSTKLGDYLRATFGEDFGKDIQIDFVGVCTGICVISNVLLTKAICPEADIRVIEKCCACVTPESHKTALAAMQMCHIEVI